jgi:uncharacterized protein (TIGR02246 family)
MANDEEQIRNLVDTWMKATTAGEPEKVLELMTDDVVFLAAGRPPMGKKEFAAAAHAQAEGAAPSFEGTSDIQEIRVIGDWAVMWTKLRVVVRQDGAEPMEREGYTLTVLRKDGGRWRIARDANLLAPVKRP